jgi:hypothetical protein
MAPLIDNFVAHYINSSDLKHIYKKWRVYLKKLKCWLHFL